MTEEQRNQYLLGYLIASAIVAGISDIAARGFILSTWWIVILAASGFGAYVVYSGKFKAWLYACLSLSIVAMILHGVALNTGHGVRVIIGWVLILGATIAAYAGGGDFWTWVRKERDEAVKLAKDRFEAGL